MARSAAIRSVPDIPPATFEEIERSEAIVWRPSGSALIYVAAVWVCTVLGAVGIIRLAVWLIG